MKFITVFLTLFAVLAQSAPVEFDEGFDEEFPITKLSVEDEEKIQKQFHDLKDALAAAKIDTDLFYCSEHCELDVFGQVFSIPDLFGQVAGFQELVREYSLNDYDFFCHGLTDSSNTPA